MPNIQPLHAFVYIQSNAIFVPKFKIQLSWAKQHLKELQTEVLVELQKTLENLWKFGSHNECCAVVTFLYTAAMMAVRTFIPRTKHFWKYC